MSNKTLKQFAVTTKDAKLSNLLGQLDFSTENLTSLQHQIEWQSKFFQQDKTKDSLNNSIASGSASNSVIGAQLKASIERVGAFLIEQIPNYLAHPKCKLNQSAKAYFSNIFVATSAKDRKEVEAFANKVAQITLNTTFDCVFNNARLEDQIQGTYLVIDEGVPTVFLEQTLGEEIERHARLMSYRDQDAEAFSKLFRQFLADPVFGDDFAYKSVFKTAQELGLTWTAWTYEELEVVGRRLLGALLPKGTNSELKGEEWDDIALFDTKPVQVGHKDTVQLVIPSEALTGKASLLAEAAINNAFQKLPLVIPPVAHTEDKVGGYHTDAVLCDKTKVRNLNSKDAPHVVLGPKVLKALNKAQSVPFVVNDFVLGWLDAIKWEMVERTNTALAAGEKFRTPSLGKFVPFVDGLSKRSTRKTYRTEATVAAAKAYAGTQFFHAWLPDYRGRLYPLSSLLSPQGTDFEKSLIKFAIPGELTESAVYWLKVQVANCFGLDKKSFAERVEWVDNNHDLISSVSEDPIQSFDTWSVASEPFMFLAACEEFYACVITKTRTMTSGLVAVDATCSGIQVLSGLTLDKDAAHLVNVSPSDTPQDAYMAVARRAIELLKSPQPLPAETATGSVMERVSFESWVHIDRSVAKKVTMTVPYNATADSNASHVSKALREKDVRLDLKEVNEIVRALRVAIQQVLPNALAFRDWLNSVAYLKAKTLDGAAFTWETPSGLKLVQPIRKWKTVKVDTLVYGRRSQQTIAVSPSDTLNIAKIRTATAPNLIHSLDASILAIACDSLDEEQFTLIHDSVLSRATDMDAVQVELRNAYDEIFSGDVYRYFSEFFTPDVSKLTAADRKKLTVCPPQGDLDPSVVKKSPYFFS